MLTPCIKNMVVIPESCWQVGLINSKEDIRKGEAMDLFWAMGYQEGEIL